MAASAAKTGRSSRAVPSSDLHPGVVLSKTQLTSRIAIVLTCAAFAVVLAVGWVLRFQAPDAAAGCETVLIEECARDALAQSLLAVAVVAIVGGVGWARPRELAARVLLFTGLAFACSMALHSWLWWQVDPDTVVRLRRAFTPLAGAAALHLFLVFPTPSPVLSWLRSFGGRALHPVGGGLSALYVAPLVIVQAVTSLAGGPSASLFSANLVIMLLLVSALASALGTYRGLPSRVARAQLKWVTYGISVGVVGQLLATLSSGTAGGVPVLSGTAATLLWVPTWVGIAVAVLRFRLFDIDFIIRRTLAYAPLTAFLAGLYAASVTLVQRLTMAATGQQSDIVVGFIVLVAATSLWPINQRLQTLVDRAFKQPGGPHAILSTDAHDHLEVRLDMLQAALAVTRAEVLLLRSSHSARARGHRRPQLQLRRGER